MLPLRPTGLPERPRSSKCGADWPHHCDAMDLSVPSRPGRHKPLCPTHRTVTAKLDEPLAAIEVQEIECNLDLSASCDTNLALDTVFAIRFTPAPDEKRLDPI